MALNDGMKKGLEHALNNNGFSVKFDRKPNDKPNNEDGLPENTEVFSANKPKKDDEGKKPNNDNTPPGFDGINLNDVLDEPEQKPVTPKPGDKPDNKPGDKPEDNQQTPSAKAFAAMRTEIKELTEQLNLLRHAETKPADTEMLNQLKEQLKAKDEEISKLSDQIGALDLERDPRFAAKYKQAEDMLIGQIRDTATEFGLSEEVINTALSYPMKKRLEYLTEEAGNAAPILLTLLSQRDTLLRQKQSELAKHREVRQQMDQQRGMQDLALEQQARARLFEGALTTAVEQGHFVFTPVEGNTARNALVQKAVTLAKELFASNDGQRQAQAMMLGVAAPVYLQMLKAEHAKVKQLEKELQSRFGKRPLIGNGGQAPVDGGGNQVPKTMTPEEAANAAMNNLLKK